MNINQLMRDLTLEQLVEVHNSLNKEMERKREELRQMVGRRYRDVLEASLTIKRLTHISNELIEALSEIRHIGTVEYNSLSSPRVKLKSTNASIQYLVLFTALYPLISGNESDVDTAIVICLISNIYPHISPDCFSSQKKLYNISDELNCAKSSLFDRIINEVGFFTDWLTICDKLVAISFMKNLTIAQLLDIYLDSRKEIILRSLNDADHSLIDIIKMVKDSLTAVENTFDQTRGALISAFETISSTGWNPAIIIQMLDDQLPQYTPFIAREMSLVISNHSSSVKAGSEPILDLSNKCFDWVSSICCASVERVKVMFKYVQNTDEVVEFSSAINGFFKDWPNLVSSSFIYKHLISDTFVERFNFLINEELIQFSKHILKELNTLDCNPTPIFYKSARKFDPAMLSGVSHELIGLVKTISNKLQTIAKSVEKCAIICDDDDLNLLRNFHSNSILEFIKKLTDFNHDKMSNMENQSEFSATKNQAEENPMDAKAALRNFQLLFSIVQYEPYVFEQCIQSEGTRAAECAKLLFEGTENALCLFMNSLINDCEKASSLNLMVNASNNWHQWLDISQEFEKSPAQVEVPFQISCLYFQFLLKICHELSQFSLGHLISRNVRAYISARIGTIISKNLMECAKNCLPVTRICAQLLFDSKTFFSVTLNKDFLDVMQIIESKMELVDLKLLQEPLNSNVKRFIQKTAVLFGPIFSEMAATTKEPSQLSVDVAPVEIMLKLNDIALVKRLPQVPRLSKIRNEEPETSKKKTKKRNSPMLDTNEAKPESLTSTSSFSTLYDKLSTGWKF